MPLALACAALVLASAPDVRPVPRSWSSGYRTIQQRDAERLVRLLAGPDFRGRAPTEQGYPAAAGFCMAWFHEHGLLPAGDEGSYFQRFTASRVSPDPDRTRLSTTDNKIALELGKDYIASASDDRKLTAPLLFVRLTNDTPLTDTGAFKGAIVILHPASPQAHPEEYARLLRLQSSGELGAIAVSVPSPNLPPLGASWSLGFAGQGPLRLSFRADVARKLAEAAGAQAYLAESPTSSSIERAPFDLSLDLKTVVRESIPTLNVLAKVEGTDPALRPETVIVGAHLDHLGQTPRGMHWGADDNASGVAATLLAARALARNPVKPRRTVVFALWSLEESGLLGSKYFTERPTVDLTRTVAYLNMDMVGRNSQYAPWNDRAEDNDDAIYLSAARITSPDLEQILREANRYVGLRLRDDKEDRATRSDTGSFIAKRIPTLKAFTGEHPDYHRPTDTPDKLNYPKLTNVARWIYLSAAELSTRRERPQYVPNGAVLRGSVTVDAPTALPADAVVEVTLLDASLAQTSPKVVDQTVITRPGLFPVRFGLVYRTDQIRPESTYVVRARVLLRGKLIFTSDAHIPVLTRGAPKDQVQVPVKPVR